MQTIATMTTRPPVTGRFDGLLAVMQKEHRANRHFSRRRRLRLFSLLLLAICLIVLVLPDGDWLFMPGYQNCSLNLAENPMLLRILVIAACCTWLVLVQTAGAFTREHEQGSLEMLLTTPLRGWEIIGGKLLATIRVLLGTAFYPLAATVLALVTGVFQLSITLWTLTLLLVLAINAASLGLLCSVYCRRTVVSLAWAYSLMAMTTFLLPAYYWLPNSHNDMLIEFGNAVHQVWAGFFLALAISGIVLMIIRTIFSSSTGHTPSRPFLITVFVCCFITAFFTIQTLRNTVGVETGRMWYHSYYSSAYLLVGNPIGGIVINIAYAGEDYPSWILQHAAPFTIIIDMLPTGALLWWATRRLDRLRRQA